MSKFAKFAAEAILPAQEPNEDEQNKPSWKEWLVTAGGLAALGGAGYLAYKHRGALGDAVNSAVGRKPEPTSNSRAAMIGAATGILSPKLMSGAAGMRNSTTRSATAAADALVAHRANPEALKEGPGRHLQAMQDEITKANAQKFKPADRVVKGAPAPAPTAGVPKLKLDPKATARNWTNLDIEREFRGVSGAGGAGQPGAQLRQHLQPGAAAGAPLSWTQWAEGHLGKLWTPDVASVPGINRTGLDQISRITRNMEKHPNSTTYNVSNAKLAPHLRAFLNTSTPKTHWMQRGIGGGIGGLLVNSGINYLKAPSE